MAFLRATPMEYAKKFVSGKTLVYMFLPQVEPPCNCRCTGCYILASEAYKRRIKRSEERVLEDVKGLTLSGYSVMLSTTEILKNERYLEMLKSVKSTYVMTNGDILVSKPGVLGGLKGIGISQVVLTANFGNSGLSLPNPDVFKEAVGRVRRAGLGVMARITLTKDNCPNIMEMVASCRQLGIRCIQFLRFMPIEKGPQTLDEKDSEIFFRVLEVARASNPGIYLSAGGSLGSQFRKRGFVCPAGKSQFAIGLDNRIYPCIYLTQEENALGRYENGNIVIEREFEIAGDKLECPAYRYFAFRNREKR